MHVSVTHNLTPLSHDSAHDDDAEDAGKRDGNGVANETRHKRTTTCSYNKNNMKWGAVMTINCVCLAKQLVPNRIAVVSIRVEVKSQADDVNTQLKMASVSGHFYQVELAQNNKKKSVAEMPA